MSDDATIPEPSFLLARHENAHREHARHTPHHHNHNHNRNHQQLHQRQEVTGGGTTAVEQATAITTAVVTISYVQQIDVDSTGSTFAIERILTNTTPNASGAAPTTTPSSSANAISSSGPSLISTSLDASASGSQSLQSVASTSLSSTSTPSTSPSVPSTIPPSSTFASLSVGSNSTTSTLISSSSSLLSTTLSNSTTSSASSTSFSSLSSSSFTFSSSLSSSSSESASTTSSSSSSTTSTSSSTSLSSSSSVQTTLAVGGAGGGSGVATTSASPSSTAGAGTSSSSNSTTPPTSVVVGSVVGSVAGFAFIILLILALVKWRKRKNMLSLGNGTEGGAAGSTTRELPPTEPAPASAMTQRRSLAFAVPSALASLTGISKRASQKTDRTASSTAGSERGFYRVSGRKLPSVLQTGGDGYGGGFPETTGNTMSGSSFYRDSTGTYGGPGPSGGPPPGGSPLSSPLATSPPTGIGIERDSGVPVMRPSPARTPVTEHGPFGVLPPPPSLQPPHRPNRPDELGRSHPSQDGSHASRFTEEV